ncbi:hypothetical protein CA267_016240 [Alteromonas pelagimontana]|uniref:Uncharacterized protein n=1 Tax=Alteromonas pelagimontana TaxID=1858656 RepID=A0A6M4MHT7_9ALTE|nr:hypothetical protein [Alteromonas pelagimontana]QJR82190.1 hypothetical protein CA267_016240 [Alteromonas pelagimontana]
MSSDLLFPILPREGKVPVKSKEKITRVTAEQKSQALGDPEKAEHDEERLVNRKEQYQRHEEQTGYSHDKREHQDINSSGTEGEQLPKQVNQKAEEEKHRATGKIKHLDIYI